MALLPAACSSSTGAQSSVITPSSTNTTVASTPTATAEAFVPCPSGSPSLADIQDGGLGATLDTFSSRWGTQSGVVAQFTSFGRYSDTGRQIIWVENHLPDNQRVWSVQYFVDTTQQLSSTQVATIAATIMPKDATAHGATQSTGDAISDHYCSAALLAAFPDGSSMNGQPMPDSGYFSVHYLLRSDGMADSIRIVYGEQ